MILNGDDILCFRIERLEILGDVINITYDNRGSARTAFRKIQHEVPRDGSVIVRLVDECTINISDRKK